MNARELPERHIDNRLGLGMPISLRNAAAIASALVARDNFGITRDTDRRRGSCELCRGMRASAAPRSHPQEYHTACFRAAGARVDDGRAKRPLKSRRVANFQAKISARQFLLLTSLLVARLSRRWCLRCCTRSATAELTSRFRRPKRLLVMFHSRPGAIRTESRMP